ncbi:MAG: hypothetical protein WCC63_01075, partial [Candidatus Bathyarchaeia archaeon]
MKMKMRRKEVHEEQQVDLRVSEETLAGYLNLQRFTVPEGYAEVETYPLKAPFSYSSIVQNEDTGVYLYIVDELLLTKEESDHYLRMKNILEYQLQAPEGEETLIESLNAQMPVII